MNNLMKCEFPFPQGDGIIAGLKTKQREYNDRLRELLSTKSKKSSDLMVRFHTDEDESDFDFRLLYLELFIITTINRIIQSTEQDKRNCVVLNSMYVSSELAPLFRIYQFPDEFRTACTTIKEYLTGERALEP